MLSGISIWQLLIILAIIVLLFGTKKLRNIGGDLGSAIRGFKDSMKDGEQDRDTDDEEASKRVIENGEEQERDAAGNETQRQKDSSS